MPADIAALPILPLISAVVAIASTVVGMGYVLYRGQRDGFNRIDIRLEQMSGKMEVLATRLGAVEAAGKATGDRLDRVASHVGALETRVSTVETVCKLQHKERAVA